MKLLDEAQAAVPRDKLLHFIAGSVLALLLLLLPIAAMVGGCIAAGIIVADKVLDLCLKPGARASECAWDAVAGLLGALPVWVAYLHGLPK